MKTLPAEAALARRVTIPGFRWVICGLLLLATTINYLDRQSISALKPILSKDLGWSDIDYAWIAFAFQLSYGLMFPIAGRLIDRLGVRRSMVYAVVVWSFAAMAHAFARSPLSFALSRFVLGIGEAANFPACIKAVAEWFPKKQRALATGILNAGTNFGIMAAPAIVFIATRWQWQVAFVATGLVGFLWLGVWLWLYRSPGESPFVGARERALLEEERAKEDAGTEADVAAQGKLTVRRILRHRQAWAFFLGKGLTDPVWFFYLTWLPAYLNKERGLSALTAAVMLVWPYIAADIGSIGGGWLSGFLIGRGLSAGRARLVALGLFALGMPGAIWAVRTNDFTTALVLISLATCCHQGWSANIFTTASDMFPRRAVGSVVGLGAMCGAIGGMFMTLVSGGVLEWFGSYTPLFVIAGVMHPLAWALVRYLGGPSLEPATLGAADEHAANRPLAIAGLAIGTLGLVLVGVVAANWSYIARVAKAPTAAGGLVASLGLLAIGSLLFLASRGRAKHA